MNMYTDKFTQKIKLIEKSLFPDGFSAFEYKISPDIPETNGTKLYTAFISVCNTAERAKIFRASEVSVEKAWEAVKDAASKFISSNSYDAEWIKADVIFKAKIMPTNDIIKQISKGYNEFFRHGISFDKEYKTALIEAEINGNRVISYKKHTIELPVVNKYLAANCKICLSSMPENVIIFDCISFFCDEDSKVYPLYSEGLNCGRRITGDVDKETAYNIINTSSEYLSFQIGFNGKFDYGFYPIHYKLIPGYNILRHASSIWSLICSYRITGDKYTLSQAELAIKYMIANIKYKYSKPNANGENTAFLVDITKNEIKAGGNAIAVIVLTEYMKTVGGNEYVKLAKELGNGLTELFNSKTGEFFHVLNYPDFSPKDKSRTVYYDGEATFALCRLYSITGDEKWLNAAGTAVDRFIREDYTRYRDHWVAYALNEITMHKPEERYFEFALKNVQLNIEKIYNQPTSYHTYLELLCVTFELYCRIISENRRVRYLKEFDLKRFVETIFHRAHHMLNGYGYPEYVMYLRYPSQIKGAFFVRHDGYRIRIDDIQHFCGAYYSFYTHYDELIKIKEETQNA